MLTKAYTQYIAHERLYLKASEEEVDSAAECVE